MDENPISKKCLNLIKLPHPEEIQQEFAADDVLSLRSQIRFVDLGMAADPAPHTGNLGHYAIYTQKKKFSQYICFLINQQYWIYHCQIVYTSCIIVTLHVPVYCVKNNASIRLYPTKFQNTRRARAAVNQQGYFLICCLILKESCS